ncbi:MAG: hypothetical protein AB7S26_20845 [Sandaracinaceae bacterium]
MDEVDDLERQFHRKRRFWRMVFIGIGVLTVGSIVAPCVYMSWLVGDSVVESAERRAEYDHTATPEQIRIVDEAAAALEAEIPERTARWRATMERDAATATADPASRCAYTLPMRQPNDASRGGSFNNLDQFNAIVFAGQQSFPHVVVSGAVLPSEPPRARLAREHAQDLRDRIRATRRLEDFAATVESAEALSGFWSYDVVVLAEVYDRPSADALGTSFTPGYLAGRAVLYDYAADAVVCVGDVEAQTVSTAVDYSSQMFNERSTLQSMLNAEMDAEIERAVARGMGFGAARGAVAEEVALPE